MTPGVEPTLIAMMAPFIAALVAPPLVRAFGARAAWALALFPLLAFVHFAGFAGQIAGGAAVAGGVEWIPTLGVRFSWLIDGLSFTFALLVTGIGTLIVLYAGAYLDEHPDLGRFMAFILLFMGAMLGLVLADDLLTLFVYWEMTSIASFLLIGFDHTRERARRAAVQALTITGGGGLILLAGLFVIQGATGAGSLSGVLATGDVLRQSPYYLAAFVLVLGGAFTKSAQFPFHVWLPNAMEAPTPVSAFLHSATMVKAGVYLLMRLNPVMGGTPEWTTVLPVFGAVTLLIGTLLAVRQTDLKLMLAYTTVASLGLLVMLVGIGNDYAIEAAVLYLIAHSLFKGALFMVAGSIDHGAGTRDVTGLGGLMRLMPVTFAAAALAALSMGGLPPFFGFLAKEIIYEAFVLDEPWFLALLAVTILGNALMLVIGFAVAFLPFLGRQVRAKYDHPHEGSVGLWLGPMVLAVVGLLAALFSGAFHAHVSEPMASAVGGFEADIYIGPVPHLNTAFLLSAATVALGLVLFLAIAPVRAAMAGVLRAIGWGPDIGFDQAIRSLIRLAHAVTRLIQPGRLEVYMTMTFALLATVLLVSLARFDEWPAIPPFPSMRLHEWAVIAIAAIGCVTVLLAQNRLTAIVSLGIQGFAVALLFLLFGAPDLSFTQFMVETLSVVILALAITRLRLTPSDPRGKVEKAIDGAVALAAGGALALVLLAVVEAPFDATLSAFFTEHSRPIAHGRNIVNVILVDFRGVDTFGEIAVVMAAGLAILALMRIRAPARHVGQVAPRALAAGTVMTVPPETVASDGGTVTRVRERRAPEQRARELEPGE